MRKWFIGAASCALALVVTAGSFSTNVTYAAPPSMTAMKAALNLNINGKLDEGIWVLNESVSKNLAGTSNNTVTFGTLWDSTYLYVGVSVLDSSLKNDSSFIADDDSVSIFIDADHNHSTTYDSKDRYFSVAWNDTTLFEKNNLKTGVLHKRAAITGGYSVELAIPWTNLGITPSAGTTIGFDIWNNDDDDGGGRDNLKAWNGTANNGASTAGFGDLTFSGTTTGTTRMGVFTGGGSVQEITNFGIMLGSTMKIAEVFLQKGHPNWVYAVEGGGNTLTAWIGTYYQLALGVPMLPNDPTTTLAIGATGSYNSHFQTLAEKLVQDGHANALIRLGWEFPGGWYRWAAQGHETDFINYWRQIVNTMRAVPGQNFEFVWNSTRAPSWDPMNAYPGDDYVDVLAIDWYDTDGNEFPYPVNATPAQKLQRQQNAWQNYVNHARGPSYIAQQAKLHGKKLAIGEWGVMKDYDTDHGGNDNPYFVQQMHDWIEDNNVNFHVYFDQDTDVGYSQITPGGSYSFPNALQKMKDLF